MPTYEAEIRFTSNIEDVRKGLFSLRQAFLETQQSISASWRKMLPDISAVSDQLTALARNPFASIVSKEVNALTRNLNTLNRQLQIGATNFAAITPTKTIAVWQQFSKVMSHLNTIYQEFSERAKVASDPRVSQIYSELAQNANNLVKALRPATVEAQSQAQAFSQLQEQLRETSLQFQQLTSEEMNQQRVARQLKQESRGTWMVFTKFGYTMQGLMAATSAYRGSITGLGMSFLFATSRSLPFVAAGAAIGATLGLVTSVISSVVKGIKSFTSALSELAGIVVRVGISAINSFIESLEYVRAELLSTYEAFGTFHGNLEASAALWSQATKVALNYGFALSDTAGAMMELSKQSLYSSENFKAVIALASKLNITLSEAAKIYATAIGVNREATETLKRYGIVVSGVTDSMTRQQVIAATNAAIMQQAGTAVEVYSTTVGAAMSRVEAGFQAVLSAIGLPIWQSLAGFLNYIALSFRSLAEAIGTVDFSLLTEPITDLAMTIYSLAKNIAPVIADTLSKVVTVVAAAIQTLVSELSKIDIRPTVDTIIELGRRAAAALIGISIGLSSSVMPVFGEILNKFNEISGKGRSSFADITISLAVQAAEWGTKFVEFSKIAINALRAIVDVALIVWRTITGLASAINLALFGPFLGGLKLVGQTARNVFGVETAKALELPFDTFVSNIKRMREIVPLSVDIKSRLSSIEETLDNMDEAVARNRERARQSAVEFINNLNSIIDNTNKSKNATTEAADSATSSYDSLQESIRKANEQIEYTPKAAKKASDALTSAWKGLIAQQLTPTMDFDYQNWMDQMTTAYYHMGRDFAAETGFARKDVWDENFRRILDIVNRGMESPWVAMFTPPENVIQRGNDAVRAWAAQLAHEFQLGMHPELINWDAFIESLREALTAKANWQAILEEAQRRAEEAGLGASSELVKAALAAEVLPGGGGAAQVAMAEVLGGAYSDAVSSVNYGAILSQSIKDSVRIYLPIVQNTGKETGEALSGSVLEGLDFDLPEIPGFELPDLAAPAETGEGESLLDRIKTKIAEFRENVKKTIDNLNLDLSNINWSALIPDSIENAAKAIREWYDTHIAPKVDALKLKLSEIDWSNLIPSTVQSAKEKISEWYNTNIAPAVEDIKTKLSQIDWSKLVPDKVTEAVAKINEWYQTYIAPTIDNVKAKLGEIDWNNLVPNTVALVGAKLSEWITKVQSGIQTVKGIIDGLSWSSLVPDSLEQSAAVLTNWMEQQLKPKLDELKAKLSEIDWGGLVPNVLDTVETALSNWLTSLGSYIELAKSKLSEIDWNALVPDVIQESADALSSWASNSVLPRVDEVVNKLKEIDWSSLVPQLVQQANEKLGSWKTTVDEIIGSIKSSLQSIDWSLVTPGQDLISTAQQAIGDWALSIKTKAGEVLSSIASIDWSSLVPDLDVISSAKSAFDEIKSKIESLIQSIVNLLTKYQELRTEIATTAVETGVSIGEALKTHQERRTDLASKAVDTLVDVANQSEKIGNVVARVGLLPPLLSMPGVLPSMIYTPLVNAVPNWVAAQVPALRPTLEKILPNEIPEQASKNFFEVFTEKLNQWFILEENLIPNLGPSLDTSIEANKKTIETAGDIIGFLLMNRINETIWDKAPDVAQSIAAAVVSKVLEVINDKKSFDIPADTVAAKRFERLELEPVG